MNNSKVKEIIKFSFFKYFQNKWFIFFNIISLVSILISLNWNSFSSIFKFLEKDKTYNIEIIDPNNIIFSEFENHFIDNEKFKTKLVLENNYTSENIKNNIIVIEISEEEKEIFKTKIISREGIESSVYDDIIKELTSIRNQKLEGKYALDSETIEIVQRGVKVERILLSVDAKDSTLKKMINLFASAITYFVSVVVFTRIANEISQEKTSKSSEYILTTVSAKEYLFAKVFSNVAILVIQFLLLLSYYIMAVSLASLFKVQATDIKLSSALQISGLSKDILIYLLALIFYNVITLTFMSIVQATLAAKTTSSAEAGNSVSITVFIIALLYILTVFLIDPYSKVNVFLYVVSVLPIVSSFFVPAMMVVGQATWLQIIISILLLILIIPKTYNKCAIAFKNGLLDYTKSKKNKKKDDSLEELLNKRSLIKLGGTIGVSIILFIILENIVGIVVNLRIIIIF